MNNMTSVDGFGYGERLLEIVWVVRAAIPCAARWLASTLLRGHVQENVLVGSAWVWRASSRQGCHDDDRHQEWCYSSVHASKVHRIAVSAAGNTTRTNSACPDEPLRFFVEVERSTVAWLCALRLIPPNAADDLMISPRS